MFAQCLKTNILIQKTFSPEFSEMMTINSYYLENESQNVQTHS